MQAIDYNFMETSNVTGKYRHKTTSVTLINYHFIWIPKRRKKVLTGNFRSQAALHRRSQPQASLNSIALKYKAIAFTTVRL